MVEKLGKYDEQNFGNKVSIVISIVTFDSHILAVEFIVAIDIFDRLKLFFYRQFWTNNSNI